MGNKMPPAGTEMEYNDVPPGRTKLQSLQGKKRINTIYFLQGSPRELRKNIMTIH